MSFNIISKKYRFLKCRFLYYGVYDRIILSNVFVQNINIILSSSRLILYNNRKHIVNRPAHNSVPQFKQRGCILCRLNNTVYGLLMREN